MLSLRALLVVLGIGSLTSGCLVGDIRVVRNGDGTGELALLGYQTDARKKADAYMATDCGANGYDVIEEGEVVVGQDSVGSVTERTDWIGGTYYEENVTTTDVTEWRLKYRCR